MISNVDIQHQVELSDGELIDLTLNVEYELIDAQSDVGIMREYAEILDITVYEEEYKNNIEVLEVIQDKIEYINNKVDEAVL